MKRKNIRLRTAIVEMDITRKQLSEQTGLSYAYLKDLEYKKDSNPTFKTMKVLSKALRKPIDYLFYFDELCSDNECYTTSPQSFVNHPSYTHSPNAQLTTERKEG